MDATEFFGTEWRAMADRIAGSLARRGVARADREDVLQETAFRLYRSWDQIDPARPVEAYARVIAYNVWRDSLRRGPREEPVAALPEVASKADLVEQACLVRDEISHVRRALQRMRPEQRNVLHVVAAEELGARVAEPAASDALRMARMRARRQLRAALQAASAIAGVLAGLRRFRPRAVPAGSASVVLAAGVLLLLSGPQPEPAGAASLGPTESGTVVGPVLDRAGERAAAAPAARKPAARSGTRPPPPAPPAKGDDPWVIDAGPASVGLLVSLDVEGYRVEVGQHDESLPVCVSGVDPSTLGPASGGADDLECRE